MTVDRIPYPQIPVRTYAWLFYKLCCVVTDTSWESNSPACLHTSPAWGWGKLSNCRQSRLAHPSLLPWGSCLSSHQWVVPLTMPQISKTGHPAYLPQYWGYFLKCPLPGKVFIFCGLFLLPSVCLNNRECYFSSSCNYFLTFNMKHDKYFCVLGIGASAQALGYWDHLGEFLEQRVSPLGLSDEPATSSTPCIRTHTGTYNVTLFCSDASESHFRAHIFYSHIEDVRYKCSSKRQ